MARRGTAMPVSRKQIASRWMEFLCWSMAREMFLRRYIRRKRLLSFSRAASCRTTRCRGSRSFSNFSTSSRRWFRASRIHSCRMFRPWRPCLRQASEKLAKLRLQAEVDTQPVAVKDTPLFTQLASELLSGGTPVRFRAEGQSMSPSLEGGELITVSPLSNRPLKQGQIVFARSNDAVIAHRIVATVEEHSQLEIKGDASDESERVALAGVLGRVTHSERDGHMNSLDTRGSYWLAAVRTFKKRTTRALALRLKNGASTAAIALAVLSASAFV